MRRCWTRLLGSVLMIAGCLIAMTGPAGAATCVVTGGWSDNCTVSNSTNGYSNLVAAVQVELKALGYYGGAIDGDYGPGTYSAIRNFQTANGLSSDGVVGAHTWNALRSKLIATTNDGYYQYYRAGSSGSIFRDYYAGGTHTWWWNGGSYYVMNGCSPRTFC